MIARELVVRILDRPKIEPVCSVLLGHFPSKFSLFFKLGWSVKPVMASWLQLDILDLSKACQSSWGYTITSSGRKAEDGRSIGLGYLWRAWVHFEPLSDN